MKVAPAAQGFFDGGSGEAKRAAELAAKLPVASLTRAWQMLLKGLFEVRDATRPISACEMALIRLAYAAELPPTDKLVKDLLDSPCRTASASPLACGPKDGSRARSASCGDGATRARAAPVPRKRPHRLHPQAGRYCRLVRASVPDLQGASRERCASGAAGAGADRIPSQPARAAHAGGRSAAKLRDWTGVRWTVSIASQGGQPTLAEQKQAAKTARIEAVAQEPIVRAVLDRFPGAESSAVRDVRSEERRLRRRVADSDEDVMPAIGSEIERLIQLLAKLPGLGPRSARRAALALLKKREPLLEPLAAAMREAARRHPRLRDLRQSRYDSRLAPSAAIRGAIRMCSAWWKMWPTSGRWNGQACSAAAIMCWAGRCRRWMA